jgi:dTMP kinase
MTSPANQPFWVSIEGPEAAGKTHLARRLAPRLRSCRLLAELTDAPAGQIAAEVVGALGSAGDPFLRTGHPLTETFALLALKTRERERVARIPVPPRTVLEDRGIDTVAVYQAAIVAGPSASDATAWALAEQIYATASPWCPLPDLTVLLVDDLDVCAARWTMREASPFTTDQRALVEQATRLYHRLAAQQPDRIRVVDRTERAEDEVLDELATLIRRAAHTEEQEGPRATAS